MDFFVKICLSYIVSGPSEFYNTWCMHSCLCRYRSNLQFCHLVLPEEVYGAQLQTHHLVFIGVFFFSFQCSLTLSVQPCCSCISFHRYPCFVLTCLCLWFFCLTSKKMDGGGENVGLTEQMACVWLCQLRNRCNGGGAVCSSVVNRGAAAFLTSSSPAWCFRFHVSAFAFHAPSV